MTRPPGNVLRAYSTWAITTGAYIAQIETGKKKNPSLDVLKRLARALRVPVTELLE